MTIYIVSRKTSGLTKGRRKIVGRRGEWSERERHWGWRGQSLVSSFLDSGLDAYISLLSVLVVFKINQYFFKKDDAWWAFRPPSFLFYFFLVPFSFVCCPLVFSAHASKNGGGLFCVRTSYHRPCQKLNCIWPPTLLGTKYDGSSKSFRVFMACILKEKICLVEKQNCISFSYFSPSPSPFHLLHIVATIMLSLLTQHMESNHRLGWPSETTELILSAQTFRDASLLVSDWCGNLNTWNASVLDHSASPFLLHIPSPPPQLGMHGYSSPRMLSKESI